MSDVQYFDVANYVKKYYCEDNIIFLFQGHSDFNDVKSFLFHYLSMNLAMIKKSKVCNKINVEFARILKENFFYN